MLRSIPASAPCKGRVLLADWDGLVPRVSPPCVCPPVKSEYEGFTGRTDGIDRIKKSPIQLRGEKIRVDHRLSINAALPLRSITVSGAHYNVQELSGGTDCDTKSQIRAQW